MLDIMNRSQESFPMSALELMIWSMAAGAMGAVVLAELTDLAFSRSLGAAQGTVYHFTALVFVVALSGIPLAVLPDMNTRVLHVVQVLIGPVCGAMGNYWLRGWLSAHQRDRIMEASLRISAILAPIAGLALLALPERQQLPAAAAICLFNSGLVLWLAVRATLMGDRPALGIAAGCVLMLPAIAGLYAMAMNVPGIGTGIQVVIALCATLCTGVIGYMLLQRNRHERYARRDDPAHSQFDPVTKLYSGITLVQKLIKAQRRRRRTRRDGAVLAIMVFDTDRVAAQVGASGLNELYIHLAMRVQRQVGLVNPVGRYYDRCFITLVETIHSPAWLRTLGLRTASALRQPIAITAANGEPLEIRPDIGVGVVHLTRDHADVEDILHDAQRMAEAARGMRSRAAILDPATGDVVPVEQAKLGGRPLTKAASRMQGLKEHVPHAIRTARQS